jgi:hypothetical protein
MTHVYENNKTKKSTYQPPSVEDSPDITDLCDTLPFDSDEIWQPTAESYVMTTQSGDGELER